MYSAVNSSMRNCYMCQCVLCLTPMRSRMMMTPIAAHTAKGNEMRDMQGHYETRTEAAHYAQVERQQLVDGLVDGIVEECIRTPDDVSEFIGEAVVDGSKPLTDAQIAQAIDYPAGADSGALLVVMMRLDLTPSQRTQVVAELGGRLDDYWRGYAERKVERDMERAAEAAAQDRDAGWAD